MPMVPDMSTTPHPIRIRSSTPHQPSIHPSIPQPRTSPSIPTPTTEARCSCQIRQTIQYECRPPRTQSRLSTGTMVPFNSRKLNIRMGSTMSNQATNPARNRHPHAPVASRTLSCWARALAQHKRQTVWAPWSSHSANTRPR